MNYLFAFTLLIGTVFISHPLDAQFNCNEASEAITELEGNAVSAEITTGGDIWWDGNNRGYRVRPPGSEEYVATIYAGGLWMAGLDENGQERSAAQQFGRGTDSFDYKPGPLNDNGDGVVNCTDWDTIFSITAIDVNNFLADFDPQATTLTEVPANISGWPGKGNPYFASINGFELLDRANGFAPFVDVNSDGVYDPLAGDYPDFIGDQALWCVFNAGGTNRQSGFPFSPLIEVQLLAYSKNGTEDDPLQRTTFYDYTLLNQSPGVIDSLFVGHWSNNELGCLRDDRANSIPARDLYYVYDRVDSVANCNPSALENGLNLPVNVYQVLRSSAGQERKMRSFFSFLAERGEVVIPPSIPLASRTSNILNGRWQSGQLITRGGGGFGAGGGVTRYMFDGGPTESGEPWLSGNIDYDRTMGRNLYSTGPYNLPPMATAEFTLAITSVFNVPRPDGETPDTTVLFAATEEVDFWFRQALSVSTEEPNSFPAPFNVRIYPNPTSNLITFRAEPNRTIRTVEIFNALGRSLLQKPGNSDALNINLRANGLEPGIYFYRVTNTSGSTASGKIVLNK